MDDPKFFQAPVSPLFTGKLCKNKCLEYITKNKQVTPIFTKDMRAYQTGGLTRMLKRISNTVLEERRYFEVIPPGVPCKLFYDLDYKLKAGACQKSASLEMDQFVSLVIAQTKELLRTQYMYEDIDMDKSIFVLCADTSHKISRHLILPAVFKSIIHVGMFVKRVKHELQKSSLSESVDTGVYTNWRNFRLLGNAKKNASNHFVFCKQQVKTPNSFFQNLLLTMVTTVRFEKSVNPKLDPYILKCRKLLATPHESPCTSSTAATTLFSQYMAFTSPPTEFPSNTSLITEYMEKEVLDSKYPKHSYSRTFQQYSGHNYVDYVISPGIPCPFNNNTIHKSNKSYFKIDLTSNVAFFRCADPACSKEKFHQIHNIDHCVCAKTPRLHCNASTSIKKKRKLSIC